MRTIIQTVEFTNGEYKGVVFEKIIPLLNDDRIDKFPKVGDIIREREIVFKVLDDKYYENFNPIEYAKHSKPINLKGS